MLLISAGNTNDISMAAALVRTAGPIPRLPADRGYDADHLRKLLAEQGAEAVKLSRGLTLEGLSVSYFLRQSSAYDSLMQMGRWFGYRPGYVEAMAA